MQDKDEVKQNQGAHQGNIHQDSDEGENEDGKAGSTLTKTSDRHAPLTEDDDNVDTTHGETPSHGGKQEPETKGIP